MQNTNPAPKAHEVSETEWCDVCGDTEMPESGVYEVSVPKSSRSPRTDSFGSAYSMFFNKFVAL